MTEPARFHEDPFDRSRDAEPSTDEAIALVSARVEFQKGTAAAFDAIVKAVRVIVRNSATPLSDNRDRDQAQPPTAFLTELVRRKLKKG